VKGVPHYKRDGTEHKGTSHKMPNGDLHTNKSHTKTSVKLFHFKDLSKKAQQKLKVNNGNNIFRVNKRSP
jgi:hypothetical protein